MITSFKGSHAFLSNFHVVPGGILLDGEVYPTVEYAYQAAKTSSRLQREQIRFARSPAQAKKLGKTVTQRIDWPQVKLDVMESLLRQKFAEPSLRVQLLDTGNVKLIERNPWGDVYWGVCRGQGSNHLGRLLMKIRGDLHEH